MNIFVISTDTPNLQLIRLEVLEMETDRVRIVLLGHAVIDRTSLQCEAIEWLIQMDGPSMLILITYERIANFHHGINCRSRPTP